MIDTIIENGYIVNHKSILKKDLAIKNGKIFKIGLLNREAGKNNFDISIHGQKFQRIIEQNRKGN